MTDDARIARLESDMQRATAVLHAVVRMGVTLFSERSFDKLLDGILVQAKTLCRADGGTLYLRTDDDHLQFVIVRNDSLRIHMGSGADTPVPFPPLALYDPATRAPNHSNVASHVALTGTTVNIADAYSAEGFEFSGTRAFDQRTGYRSQSFLTVPLKNAREQVIGVLQLLNAQADDGQVVAFDPALAPVIESLSLLASAALESHAREAHLREQIRDLHIQVDSGKRAQQVAEIADTDYFRQLQRKARELRAKP